MHPYPDTHLATVPPLLLKFENAYESLSKQNKRVCAFIRRNHLKAAFLTAAEVAEQAGVSPATVVRFSTAMGFSGFSALQKELQAMAAAGLGNEYLRVKPDPVRSRISSERAGMVDAHPNEQADHPLFQIAKLSACALDELADGFDEEARRAFDEAARLLFNARRIVVTGHKASTGIAAHAAYVLSKVHAGVSELYSLADRSSFSTVEPLGQDDVLLAFAVIYYPRETLDIIRVLAEKGVRVVLVCDFRTFPEAKYASASVLIPLRFHGFLDQMAPALAVADALAYDVFSLDEEKGRARLKAFNAFNESVGAFSQIGRFSD